MKFSELREADLSKAQIKKVHDKADDLPKNDFIKRYGKEGDAVRFATATNIVKKQLGIGEALDDKDKETIKPIIKQLQKSVTAHGKQAKQLQKDIKDEVEEGFKNDAQRQAAVASLYSKLGLKGASKRSREKDKGKKKEEVEITEAISDAQVAQIARMTDRNDHFGVRIEIARLMKDKQLMSFYDSLEKMHMTSQIQNAIGNDAVSLRGKLEKVLKVRMKQRFGDKDSKRIMDAL